MEDLLTKEKTDLKVPRTFNVVLLNDDFTPVDFVVEILIRHFGKSVDEAVQLAIEVHKSGRGIAGTFARDTAETKATAAEKEARQDGHPLKLEVQAA